eukprot:146334-Chlamydomonas_euryale.AAC.2
MLPPPALQYGLNTVFESYTWLDDTSLVASVLPDGVSAASAPQRPGLPFGPKVQDNSTGRKSQVRGGAFMEQHLGAAGEQFGVTASSL